MAFRFYDANIDGTGDEQFASHHGNFNVTSLVNASGTVIERYNYKPYGKLDVLNASYVSIGSTTVENPFTYTGRRIDAETKLY